MHEDELGPLVGAMLASYRRTPKGHHINRRFLPSREEIIEVIDLLLQVLYPGYHGRQDLTDENIAYHVGGLLNALREKLARQIEMCLCFREECEACPEHPPSHPPPGEARCAGQARRLASELLRRLPALREALLEDVQAAYDGDPAATSLAEVILAYPGFLAVTVHRVAHELYTMDVPLMPRIMAEWAHTHTGADIHPGATLGASFFIDHATGVVIGETSRLGSHVKLYQGVTLGALSHPRDASGRVIRNTRRHPTVEDGVTVYANATVLGGDTVLGAGSVVGGSVFVTKSVPQGAVVAMKPPELSVRASVPAGPRDPRESTGPTDPQDPKAPEEAPGVVPSPDHGSDRTIP
ncbi:MAG: serine acetyltransferase [Deltaproteobacteria bacterium]|nr:serine acetyltransferase [Deltaproteobacteria bacterium]